MNGEFSHRSENAITFAALLYIAGFAATAPIDGVSPRPPWAQTIFLVAGTAIFAAVVMIAGNIKSSFRTEPDGVYFKVGRREYIIPYGEITDISCSVKKHHRRHTYKYRIVLTVKTTKKTYRFNDELNTSSFEIHRNTAEYEKKINMHCFSRLCEFIAACRRGHLAQ